MFKYSRLPNQFRAQKITYASVSEFRFWLINYNFVISVLKVGRGCRGKFVPEHALNTYGGCVVIVAATPPNQPQRCILTDYFNNYNFSKAQIMCSLMMVIEPKHVGDVLM